MKAEGLPAPGVPTEALRALTALAIPEPPVGPPRHRVVRKVLRERADALLEAVIERRHDFVENESRGLAYRHGWALPSVPELTNPVGAVMAAGLEVWCRAFDIDVGDGDACDALELADVAVTAFLDGDFLSQHRDDGKNRGPNGRVLSFVYWLHRRPRAFSGGMLRLCGWARHDGALVPSPPSVDLDPDHDALVVFPSSTMHEVFPVRLSSQQCGDGRFAITGFVRRRDARP